jgi:hypothetical protein
MSEGTATGQQTPNIIKCRDDHRPVLLARTEAAGTETPRFMLADGTPCSWAKAGEPLGQDELRTRIEPWLTALWQSEHLSVLLGSGLTNAVHRMATGEGCTWMAPADFGEFNDPVAAAAAQSAQRSGRGDGNIEDQIRAANELLRGLQILGSSDEVAAGRGAALETRLGAVVGQFAEAVLLGERALVTAEPLQFERAFTYLVTFLMSFGSRTGTRDRLHLFTTNYDRVIEAGAEAAGMYLLDRFVGTLAPILRSSRLDLDLHYNPPGIRGEPRYVEGVARFTKLHGSLDWIDRNRKIRRVGVPLGAASIAPHLADARGQAGSALQLMIYPNAAKDRETAAYPYVDLFRDFAAATCRPNHTLVTFGYGFGDEHINRVIEDMLTIPSAHLVVMSYSDPLGRIMRMYEGLGRHAQISLLVGDHVGEFVALVDNYLPKPAIDLTTFRMAELLKARWGVVQGEKDGAPEASIATRGEAP